MAAQKRAESGSERYRDLLAERRVCQAGRVTAVAHVRALDKHLRHGGQVQAAEVGADIETSRANVIRKRLAGDGTVFIPDVEPEPAGRTDDLVRVTGHQARFDDLEPRSPRRPAVRVDRDRRVGVSAITDGCALGDAWAHAAV